MQEIVKPILPDALPPEIPKKISWTAHIRYFIMVIALIIGDFGVGFFYFWRGILSGSTWTAVFTFLTLNLILVLPILTVYVYYRFLKNNLIYTIYCYIADFLEPKFSWALQKAFDKAEGVVGLERTERMRQALQTAVTLILAIVPKRVQQILLRRLFGPYVEKALATFRPAKYTDERNSLSLQMASHIRKLLDAQAILLFKPMPYWSLWLMLLHWGIWALAIFGFKP